MELLHVSLLLSRLIEKLPAYWHDLFMGSLGGLTLFFVLILVWRVSHVTQTLPHGETRTVWLPPNQWYRRWLQLRAEGYANAPGWFLPLIRLTRSFSNLIGAFFMGVLGLFCIAIGVVVLGLPGGILAVLGGLGCFWLVWIFVKPDPEEPH